jgi:hypothetical protein
MSERKICEVVATFEQRPRSFFNHTGSGRPLVARAFRYDIRASLSAYQGDLRIGSDNIRREVSDCHGSKRHRLTSAGNEDVLSESERCRNG